MKILLIGHSIIDNIEENGRNNIKPGGIYYTVKGLFSILNSDDQVYLLTGWNHSNYKLFSDLYSKIDLSFSEELYNMPEVILKITNNDREELYKNLSGNLNIEKISNWNLFEGILINMITGFDLSLKQLKEIRSKYLGIIFLDIHTLSRGVNSKMERVYRQIPNVEEWLKCIDILQVNQFEIKTIFNEEDEIKIVKNIFEYGTKIILVTKGNNGVTAYFNIMGELNKINLPAEPVIAINTVGCGDFFGAVFFSSYLRDKNILESLIKANSAAAKFASSK